MFDKPHRAPPLKLRTHRNCNNNQSGYDELIAQLVPLLSWRTTASTKEVNKLRLSVHHVDALAAPLSAVEWFPLRRIVIRWLMAFHAALYNEHLVGGQWHFHEPFPGGDTLGQDTILHAELHAALALTIKKSRKAKELDVIWTNSGRFQYECVWSHFSDGSPICIFAINLYDWHLSGNPNFPTRSCVGWYNAKNGIPSRASRATEMEIPVKNSEPLNAFEQ